MKKILTAILMVMILIPSSVGAQENEIEFENLVIEFWPEYDQPGVLVIYQGQLASSVTFPAEISFLIPVEVGNPNAVAFRDEQGQLIPIQETRVVRGEYAEIQFTTTSSEIQFEYYDPALEIDGDQRSYLFRWPETIPVAQSRVWVQQPKGASNLETNPPLTNSLVGSDNLQYFYGDVELAEDFTLEFSYQKSSPELSVEGEVIEPAAPVEPGVNLSVTNLDWVPIVLSSLGIAAILVAGFLYWWFQSDRPSKLISAASPSEKQDQPRPNYCPRCGNKTEQGDQFCRICGEKF